jgi:hypothetical protein
MNPSIDDRLSSIMRAMTDVILPALPPDAGLAREQLQLCLGHLSILRPHIDGCLSFEQEALDDAARLAAGLLEAAGAQGVAPESLTPLRSLLREGKPPGDKEAINRAICDLLEDHPALSRQVQALVIAHEQERTTKDRRWFAPMGFDREFSA